MNRLELSNWPYALQGCQHLLPVYLHKATETAQWWRIAVARVICLVLLSLKGPRSLFCCNHFLSRSKQLRFLPVQNVLPQRPSLPVCSRLIAAKTHAAAAAAMPAWLQQHELMQGIEDVPSYRCLKPLQNETEISSPAK